MHSSHLEEVKLIIQRISYILIHSCVSNLLKCLIIGYGKGYEIQCEIILMQGSINFTSVIRLPNVTNNL